MIRADHGAVLDELINPLAMMRLRIFRSDRAVLHAMQRRRIHHDRQIYMSQRRRKSDRRRDAVNRNEPRAHRVVEMPAAKPEYQSRRHHHTPYAHLQCDVHLLAAVVEALLGNSFGVHAEQLERKSDQEFDIVDAEAEHLVEHLGITFASDQQSDNRSDDEHHREESVRILQCRRPEHVIQELERQRCDEQHQKRNAVEPVAQHKAHLMPRNIFFVHQHLKRLPSCRTSCSTRTRPPSPRPLPRPRYVRSVE